MSQETPNQVIKSLLDRAISDAQKEIPSEEITYFEMMENLAYARRLAKQKDVK